MRRIVTTILISAAALSAVSCSFLDREPNIIEAGTFYNSESEVQYGLAGIYGVMNNEQVYGNYYSLMLSNVDDLSYFNRSTTNNFSQQYTHDASSTEIYDAWKELYAGIGWKMLRLDIGMADRPFDYGGLSLTGGNLVWSGNSRNVPGYNLQVDWVEIPGTKGILALKANYADYKTLDDRYVDGAMLHNKSVYAKIRLHGKVYLRLGLEQWSMWGGTSPVYGRQPHSFTDYLRVVCGMSGGSGATQSDRINVLGDHRGRELIQVDWLADSFTLTVAHDIPFDDGSGMGFQNFPDGVNTVFFSFRDRNRWVTDILYEFVYTKWQSGTRHDRPAKPDELERNPEKTKYTIGGRDNYFNNGEYRSGWTYYGRTIGLPLFTPMPAGEDGTVLGVANNRVTAHHVGIAGKFARKVPYRFKATYSKNFGIYPPQRLSFFDTVPEQLSLALETDFPQISAKFPVSVSVGVYGDVGELYSDNFGLTVRLSYSGTYKNACR